MSNFMNNEEHIELEEGEILIDNEEYTSNRTNRTELHRMGLNVGGWRKPTHRVQRYDLSRTFCYTR